MADFFDKIKKSIDKGVTTVGVKSSTILETAKLKGYITSLNDTKEQMITDMGNNIFNSYLQEQLDLTTIGSCCKEIAALNEKINEKIAELERIQNEEKEILGNTDKSSRACACGKPLSADANFCTSCGKSIVILERRCACGAALDSDARFCTGCGAKIGN